MAEAFKERVFEIYVGETPFTTEDSKVTGRDILSLAGFTPASSYTLIRFLDGGTLAVGLDEPVDLSVNQPIAFQVFEGDRIFRAILNEREIVWGNRVVSAEDLRSIGNIPMDQDLYLDSDGDRAIADDGEVRLSKAGVERIRSGDPKDQTVDIVLNGELIEVEKGRLSFSDLAKMAFPELFGRPQICFTVSFSRGPRRRREGILLEGDKVRVVEGMVFCVSATDKS